MINKLEKWAWAGGAILATLAGMVNAVGYLGYTHQAISHLTGTTTLVAISLAEGSLYDTAPLALVIASFFTGCILSGCIIQHSTLRLGRRYGVALFLEGLLLFVAARLLGQRNGLGSCFASAACGLQNAMVSSYSGAVLRTTHVSGMITDIGLALGHWLRRLPVDWLKIRLYLLLTASFFWGGMLGARIFDAFAYLALYIPAVLICVVAAGYSVYSFRKTDPQIRV